MIYKPVVKLVQTNRMGAKEGDNVSFKCHIKAHPEVTNISWFLDGKLLVQESAAVLTLDRVTRDYHGAGVKCSARNTVGVGQDQIQLQIRCKFDMDNVHWACMQIIITIIHILIIIYQSAPLSRHTREA